MTDDWYSAENATFGDRIEAARSVAGMTQGQLAKRLGIKLGTLRSWEEDLSEPRANKLQMLAGLLNVSFTWLLTGEGDGVAPPDEAEAPTPDPGVLEALQEMRALRTQMTGMADRLALLEKRIRKSLKEPAA
ncbi:helix-turn-helix domain-containing protein [Pseudooceanicola sediminis]|uniref:Helix-turn-helix domain-containing protein n=1 Tax=Pseudooceanicola sediminis TaxID=2211117 RepID=A0A399J3Q5_9RHOB|nr:helix-turn-helix domain-containing protein [Pseudooceanicola sediminis]KAA2314156.1 helix-turn-helix domain-containing protein [Puniceibacterium sp. HSS470]RII39984.1 helix-turn-helix domain-containing protein [Pseudooceanicola sediminis]|tara:strand:+ start:46602 stop:46997 length:396 start_codon:yes stop_codon:yes gene_type:complete